MNDNSKLEQKTEISTTTSKGITSLRYLCIRRSKKDAGALKRGHSAS